ncbi:hypothetical protein [Mycolicibacterium sp. CR10]|uniref:hypothetical protein n=1 Tax=Mycolicibacterium sp. CR10 TaxID=2562314 RepID=UPI0010BFB9A6|nr:hypothetical protein [Mycolicibacterium sp. CR10]
MDIELMTKMRNTRRLRRSAWASTGRTAKREAAMRGLYQHVVSQSSCWFSASAQAAPSTDRAQDGAPQHSEDEWP